MNIQRLIICVFVCIMLSSDPFADDSTELVSVRKIVQEFCQAEFEGIRDVRFNLVKFSHNRKSIEEKKDPLFGGRVIFWEATPIVIVSFCKTMEIKIKDNQAEASIHYNRLARTEGEGTLDRIIIPDFKDLDIIKIKLIREKTQWLIVDPPLPRVSIDYLISFFRNSITEMRDNFRTTINEMGDKWLDSPNVPTGQKNFYLKMEENLNILEKIKSQTNRTK